MSDEKEYVPMGPMNPIPPESEWNAGYRAGRGELGEVEIRKWCIEQTLGAGVRGPDISDCAELIYEWVTQAKTEAAP